MGYWEYTEFWKKIRKEILLGCNRNLVHQKILYIVRFRHLKNHTEAVNLYFMNWHLKRFKMCGYVVSLSVIPWMIDLSGELSRVMKNGSIIANLTPRNSGSVPAKLPNSVLKKSVRSESNVVCLVEFWRCDSLGVCAKRASSRCGFLFSITVTSSWNLRRRYPTLVKRSRLLLQQDNERPHTARTTMTKIQKLGGIELLPHPALILRLQITIGFDPWPISCVEEISKTLKLWKWVSPNCRIKNQRLVPSRDKEPRWKMVPDHRIWWSLLWKIV